MDVKRNEAPVWVRGRVAYRTRKAVSIVALDRYSRERHHVCPVSLVQRERSFDGAERDFLVPAWWAFKAKLVPLLTDYVSAEVIGELNKEAYKASQSRVLPGQPFRD